ncbi:MAG: SDR family NAD(P)-dependent oxidoreductase [Anaerovoracaceae bacterium]
MEFFSLRDKVVVITGAGSGLGLATAKRFIAAGAKVTAADISDEAENIAREIGAYFVKTDVRDEAQVENLMKKAAKKFGALDVVINNAGIIPPEELIEEGKKNTYQSVQDVNVMGVVYGIKYGQKYMKDGGAILNTASNSANGDYAGYGPYIASKISVVGLTKVAAIELAERNIRVNCICPNTIDTPMAYVPGCETELKVMAITTPLGRMCKPEEAAALYHFLASDDCMYITGEDIYIDGGAKAGPSNKMIEAVLKSLK